MGGRPKKGKPVRLSAQRAHASHTSTRVKSQDILLDPPLKDMEAHDTKIISRVHLMRKKRPTRVSGTGWGRQYIQKSTKLTKTSSCNNCTAFAYPGSVLCKPLDNLIP